MIASPIGKSPRSSVQPGSPLPTTKASGKNCHRCFDVSIACSHFHLKQDRSWQANYTSETEVYWNNQKTITDTNGEPRLVAEDGEVYAQSECTFEEVD